jgi:hypothetical protein
MIDDGQVHHSMIFILILGAGLEDCLPFNATDPTSPSWDACSLTHLYGV